MTHANLTIKPIIDDDFTFQNFSPKSVTIHRVTSLTPLDPKHVVAFHHLGLLGSGKDLSVWYVIVPALERSGVLRIELAIVSVEQTTGDTVLGWKRAEHLYRPSGYALGPDECSVVPYYTYDCVTVG